MVGFAGYAMPVQYEGMGVMKEHLHTRQNAGLFDVSHMGQVYISSANFDPADALEQIIPSDLKTMKPGHMRYSVLLNDQGGIIDDLIITRLTENSFYLVLNASRIKEDLAALDALKSGDLVIEHDTARILVAIQGPKAEAVLRDIFPAAAKLSFMQATLINQDGHDIIISRSGYTGEDGFEISLPHPMEGDDLKRILDHPDVRMIGLGARDSLRLEAGLCLYGHDLNEEITPIEAGLNWVIQKNRRAAADFAGAKKILKQIEDKPAIKRVGLIPDGRAPLREGVTIVNDNEETVGHITSGTFSPCLEKPIAMGYIQNEYAKNDADIYALLRGKKIPVTVTKLPFVESNTKK
tara:strand:- start:4915 stop:5967 length:1053 start_codon:yes stop_codon:yes gene_type:complete